MKEINPKMLLLARESRGLTQQLLAERIGSNKVNLSRWENGEAVISPELLSAVSEATGYPLKFFFQKGHPRPVSLVYRKRQTVPSKILTPIEAQINIVRMHIELLAGLLDHPVSSIPVYELSDKNTPAIIAGMVRKDLGINSPVIENITRVLEERKLLIHQFDFGTERVDSRTILTNTLLPVVILNASLLGDKQRFSLAYELGHIVMHAFNNVSHERNIGHEANEFAAEFLMPADAIRKDLENGVTLPLLGELKKKWKVSMIALLYRADDLGLLTPNQKRYLLQQFNQQRIRRREPVELDIPAEQPVLISQMITSCRTKMNLHINDMAKLLSIQESDFLELYGMNNN